MVHSYHWHDNCTMEMSGVILQVAKTSLNLKGNILQKLQLPHHDSISLILLVTHTVTKALL